MGLKPYTESTMLRYAITSRVLFPCSEREQLAALLKQAERWVKEGIEMIQLREKDLPAAAVVRLARSLLETIARCGSRSKLLVNSRPDIAIAAGAHGVHLTASSGGLSPAEVRSLFAVAGVSRPVITISCHTIPEVVRARDSQIDAVLFAPVFEKPLAGQRPLPGHGLDRLCEACAAARPVPVYALGGVTQENASACLDAGAAGVAGIRLFHIDPLC